jgi:hypothetical protein
VTGDLGERFADLFRATYLTFHRRDGPRSQLAAPSRAVLEHLAMAGPLTIGEAAILRLLHRRVGRAPVLRRAFRPHGRLAGPP